MRSKTLVLLITAVLAVVLSACEVFGINIDGGKLTVDVTLNEEQVNGLIARATAANGRTDTDFLLDNITRIEMIEPNTIRVFGDVAGMEGSYDMTIDAVDGALQIRVAAVDIPGITMDDPRIQEAQSKLGQAFLDQVQSGDPGHFTDISVIDNELKFAFEAPLNR
jgi:hypothetical protein